MAMNMDAILRVTTKVGGAEQLNALGQKFNGLQAAATGLTKAGGLLGGALGSLAPLASIAGITALISKTIDAADNMHNLSMRTGVSVENLGKLNKAAKLSGTDIDTVSAALNRLSKAMVASVSSSRFSEMTKEEADEAVRAVRDGERAQTRIINDQADARVNALERETDRRLGEISKRYRREEQLINDNFDDAADKAQQADEDATDRRLKAINRFYDARRKLIRDDETLSEQEREAALQRIEDIEDNELDIIRDGAAQRAKERQRANRNERQEVLDNLQARKQAEETALKDRIEAQKKTIKEGADFQVEQIRLASEAQQAAYKDASKPIDDLSQQMEEMGLNGKKAAEIFARLGVSVKATSGELRNPYDVMLDLFDALNKTGDSAQRTSDIMSVLSKSGTKMGEMISMGGAAIDAFKVSIDTGFANMADKYKDDLIALGGAVGRIGVEITQIVLPALVQVTPYIIGFVKGISDLPGPVKAVAAAVVVLGVGISALSLVLLPIIALFAGPAGLVVGIGLAVVAIGTLAYTFRDKLGGLPAYVWELMQNIVNPVGAVTKTIISIVTGLFTVLGPLIKKGILAIGSFLSDRFKDIGSMISSLATGAGKILGGIADTVKGAFMAVPNAIRGAINAALSWAGNAVNGVIDLVNELIVGVNKLPAAVGLRIALPIIPRVSIPQFATGAYVTGPTRAVVGEGGEPEYVIPASRMAAASTAYIQGSRGAAVVNGQAPAGGGSRPPVVVNLTGPTVNMDGRQWVTAEAAEAIANRVADDLWQAIASPAGRLALGGA